MQHFDQYLGFKLADVGLRKAVGRPCCLLRLRFAMEGF